MPSKGVASNPRVNTPAQIRTRLRRGTARIEDHWDDLGIKPIEEWTFEELAAGKPKGLPKGNIANGSWMKSAIRDEIMKRFRGGILEEMKKHVPKAVEVLADFLLDDENPTLRFNAAKLFLEYIAGAPEKRVAIQQTSQVEVLLADVIDVDDTQMYTGQVIDGELAEEDDDDLPGK